MSITVKDNGDESKFLKRNIKASEGRGIQIEEDGDISNQCSRIIFISEVIFCTPSEEQNICLKLQY